MRQDQEEALDFQIRRAFATLSGDLLMLIEDLKKNHNINFNKLRSSLPEDVQDIIEMSDYFDENHYAHIRKRVLDIINKSKRNLESNIKQ